MGIAEENGRLPLKRGPKALQKKEYHIINLTKKGVFSKNCQLMGLKICHQNFKNFFVKSEPKEKEF